MHLPVTDVECKHAEDPALGVQNQRAGLAVDVHPAGVTPRSLRRWRARAERSVSMASRVATVAA